MYKARYYKADGKKGRARALPDALFDGVVNEVVLHQSVKAYLANQRPGHGIGQDAVRGFRREQQAVQAKGDRTRPPGNAARSAHAGGRPCISAPPAQLGAEAAAQGEGARAALRAEQPGGKRSTSC